MRHLTVASRSGAPPLAEIRLISTIGRTGALERFELKAILQRAVHQLPEALREAIVLFYFEGYDSDSAARILDIPPGTLRRRLHDGRNHLRSTVDHIFRGSKRMSNETERQIEKFKALMDTGEVYQALRGALALRPVPHELIQQMVRRQIESEKSARAACGEERSPEDIRAKLEALTHQSRRASDPSHPVGAIVEAIRKALPDFQDWPFVAADAATRFLNIRGAESERLPTILAPGFAEGRPGAFVRATRGLVCVQESGSLRGVYEQIQESPDSQAFRAGMKDARLSDVLDLTWMVAGGLELRSVQELLERVSAVVLPEAEVRFSSYDEPRYRAALRLHLNAIAARAAHGGVLTEWVGRPKGVEAAHVRIFLEPWAMVQSGTIIELDRLPL